MSYNVYVTDRGKKECVDPEGNGVTMNKGAEGARPTQWRVG